MNSVTLKTVKRPERKGAALVEFSVVLPVVLIFLVGALELGRAVQAEHTLFETARAACRLYSIKADVSEQEVTDIITNSLTAAGISNYTTVLEPDPSVEPAYKAPMTVTITVPYDQIAWSPSSWFLSGVTLKGVCTMPADTTGTIYYLGGKTNGTPAPPPPPFDVDDDDGDDDDGDDDDGDPTDNDDDNDDQQDGDDDDD